MNTPQKKNIALVSGFWGQNMGNAFFNIGGMYVLRKIFPEHNVQFIQDQPGYWTFNRKRVNPKNYFGLLGKLEVEYIVLQGPIFSLALSSLWDKTLEELYARGGQVIYLSAAFFRYTDEEYRLVQDFLLKYPPAFLSTRDSQTYDKLKDYCKVSYNGICSAWFVPEVYTPLPVASPPYTVMNFDRLPEPSISYDCTNEESKVDVLVQYDSLNVKLIYPRILYWLSKKGKGMAYLGAFFDFRRLSKTISNYLIVRTEHRTNPHFAWKIYKNSNSVASDDPYTYFTVYANASLVLTDRVHACLIALAYGKPAMLFTSSPRSRLFERLGFVEEKAITKAPASLDMDLLELEKKKQLDFLADVASKL